MNNTASMLHPGNLIKLTALVSVLALLAIIALVWGGGTAGAGEYEIIIVPVDMKPTSCPNPILVPHREIEKRESVVSIAMVGTEDFKVSQFTASEIESAKIQLSVYDATYNGGSYAGPVHRAVEDVAKPYSDWKKLWEEQYQPGPDDCTTEGPDKYQDLVLKFRTEDVAKLILDYQKYYRDMKNGYPESLVLQLKAEIGGGKVYGKDVARILRPQCDVRGEHLIKTIGYGEQLRCGGMDMKEVKEAFVHGARVEVIAEMAQFSKELSNHYETKEILMTLDGAYDLMRDKEFVIKRHTDSLDSKMVSMSTIDDGILERDGVRRSFDVSVYEKEGETQLLTEKYVHLVARAVALLKADTTGKYSLESVRLEGKASTETSDAAAKSLLEFIRANRDQNTTKGIFEVDSQRVAMGYHNGEGTLSVEIFQPTKPLRCKVVELDKLGCDKIIDLK